MLASEKRSKAMRRVNRDGVPTIGIVGYTNAGKTTLMNQLTDADFKERDLLFQTLDTVMRKVKLPSGGHAIIADSIGFIQHLPHNLFAAFQSTFEEIVNCDVLIHVRDISHPQRTMQKDIVLRTLRSAGMSEDKLQSAVIEVWNKIDLMKSMDFVPPEAVPICAADGTGVPGLLAVLDIVIGAQVDKQRRTVTFPQARMSQALSFLRKYGAVDEETLTIDEEIEEEAGIAGSRSSGGDPSVSIEAVLSAVGWKRWTHEFMRTQESRIQEARNQEARTQEAQTQEVRIQEEQDRVRQLRRMSGTSGDLTG
ncbi:unnamed protein product [Polarella glacialis]|uniref:Hflx-type G domain-containing protein n=1 Tax=Polarella glacialis TaxID=89957 RepID=A0A813DNY8_POLGL|nr:unnamed protein product [Polarella glacialis]